MGRGGLEALRHGALRAFSWLLLSIRPRAGRFGKRGDLYELTPDGTLLGKIDVDFPSSIKPSGVTIAPGTTNPALRNSFVSDRHVDNDGEPTENEALATGR
jgi:hypothetical protein